MSTLSVTTLNTGNGTTDQTLTTGNTTGGKIVINSSGNGMAFYSNSSNVAAFTAINANGSNFNIPNKLNLGSAAGFDFGNLAVIEIDSSANTYQQIVIQNANSGTNASGDLIVTNDTGNDTVGFVDLGINSSTYSNTLFNIGAAGDGYLYASNGALTIGTASAKDIVLHSGGTVTANERMRITATGNVGIGCTSPTVLLTISANSGTGSATFSGGNSFFRISGNTSAFSEPAMEFGELALSPTAKIASKNEGEGGGSLYFITRPTTSNTSTLTTRMRISSTGTLTFSNTYGITVTTPRNLFIDSGGNVGGISSTRSSKININPIDDVNWIYQFEPVTFNYRSRDEEGNLTDIPESELMYGLIAEDVEPINDDFCIYVDGKLSGVHYDRLISPLIQAVKDLKKITTEQQTIIDSLINRIEVLEANR
jgi:hypothetical protein